jgi:hypothetical protein
LNRFSTFAGHFFRVDAEFAATRSFIAKDFSGFRLFYQGFRQCREFRAGIGLPDHTPIGKHAENFAAHRAAQRFHAVAGLEIGCGA